LNHVSGSFHELSKSEYDGKLIFAGEATCESSVIRASVRGAYM
jgi:hypothetical protein